MRALILSTALAVLFSLAYVATTYASCNEGPPNTFTCIEMATPDSVGLQVQGNDNNLIINMLPGSAIDTSVSNGGTGVAGIDTGDGNNTVTLNMASVTSEDDSAIETLTGNDTFNITDSVLSGGVTDDGIEAGAGDDIVNLLRTVIVADDDGVSTSDGVDSVTVDSTSVTGRREGLELSGEDDTVVIRNNSTVIGTESCGVEASFGNDTIMVENSTVSGGEASIGAGDGDDLITLKTRANITDIIDCGPDFDTIVFAIQVPTDQLAALTAEIESADPAGDTIIINNLVYEWIDCEDLVAQLEGGFEFPVPTLSQWGSITAAVILGIVGFMVIRRRQLAA